MDDQDISYKCNAPHRFGTSCCHGLLLACTFNSKRCSWRRHAALAWAERHRITCARVPEVFCDHASWLPVSLHQQVVLLFFPLSLSLSLWSSHQPGKQEPRPCASSPFAWWSPPFLLLHASLKAMSTLFAGKVENICTVKLYKRKGQKYPAVLTPRTCKLLLWRTSTVVCLVFKKEHSHPSSGPGTDSWDLLQFVHGTAALPLHGHLLSDFLQSMPPGHDAIYTLNSFKLAPFSFKAQTIDVVSLSMVFIGRLTNLELTCIHVTSTDYGCGRPILLLHWAQLRTTPALITGSKSVHRHQKIATRYRL